MLCNMKFSSMSDKDFFVSQMHGKMKYNYGTAGKYV